MRSFPFLLLLAACDDVEGGFEERDGLQVGTFDTTTGGDGYADVTLNVSNASSLLLTVQSEGDYLPFVNRVIDPAGDTVLDAETLWNGDEQQTSAIFPDQVVSLNWPPLGSSEPLADGAWTIELCALDSENYPVPRADLAVDGQLKDDGDDTAGTLSVDVVFAGDFSDEMTAAIEDAIDHWRLIYEDIGLDLDVEEYDYDATRLAAPGDGNSSDYQAIAESTRYRAVNVVIVEDITGQSDILGIAGGIPGAITPSAMSAVTISASMNAGPDLLFDDEEVLLLGETLAHEVGHYTGLFHPVEGTWDSWDALGDTARCASQDSCVDALAENLMFPFPVCDSSGCIRQRDVTGEQAETTNLYTAVQ